MPITILLIILAVGFVATGTIFALACREALKQPLFWTASPMALGLVAGFCYLMAVLAGAMSGIGTQVLQ